MRTTSNATIQVSTQAQQAADPATPAELLCALARTGETTIRAAIASNPDTPLETLLDVGADYPHELPGNPALLLLLLEHPDLPAQLQPLVPSLMRCEEVPMSLLRALEHLCDDYGATSPELLHAVVHHPRVGRKRRSGIYRRYLESIFAFAERHGSMWYGYTALRLVAFASAHLSPDLYQRGAASNVWIERYIVARNPATPREIVEMLTHDGHTIVRASARAALMLRDDTEPPSFRNGQAKHA